VWRFCAPPRIKLFLWRCYSSALPTAGRLARRIPNFSRRCSVCDALEEADGHALYQCPLARAIWKETQFSNLVASISAAIIWDVFFLAIGQLEIDQWSDFIVKTWSVWNT